MPVLSEIEMRECVGGDIIYLNEDEWDCTQ